MFMKIWKIDFRELKRKHAAGKNSLWPHEILHGRVFAFLFSNLFSKILENVK